jgi:hypothetical protein
VSAAVLPADKSRWVELAITIMVSAVTSSVAVTWSIATNLESIRAKQAEHDRSIIELQSRLSVVDNHQDDQGIKIATLDAHYIDILARLNEISAALKEDRRR